MKSVRWSARVAVAAVGAAALVGTMLLAGCGGSDDNSSTTTGATAGTTAGTTAAPTRPAPAGRQRQPMTKSVGGAATTTQAQ